MKKLTQLLIAFFIGLTAFVNAADIFVSENGNDFNAGNEAKPLQTLQMAQRKARELRRLNDPSIKDGINIILKGGTYRMVEPVVFRPEDSGNAHSITTITSAEGEKVIISGGVKVTGWQKVDEHVYKATLDRDTKLRTLFVNGRRMHMAGTDVPVRGLGDWG